MSENAVICPVCFRRCALAEGKTGFCRARKNEGGASVCASYGRATSLALDPVEKKPLARFCRGKNVLSVGGYGCNMNCPFCQNFSIARAGENDVPWRYIAPDELAALARELQDKGNIGAAFTYNEPMVAWEYVRDAAREVRASGMKNVVVTNGSVSLDALGETLPFIDAFNIDLKCFSAEAYKKLGGDLEATLAFIRAAARGAHVELTTLIVPDLNDSPDEIRELAAWAASVDGDITLHITRFFPRHKMDSHKPTDVELLYRLADAAREKLKDVVVGNV